jgi:hypothetical protein
MKRHGYAVPRGVAATIQRVRRSPQPARLVAKGGKWQVVATSSTRSRENSPHKTNCGGEPAIVPALCFWIPSEGGTSVPAKKRAAHCRVSQICVGLSRYRSGMTAGGPRVRRYGDRNDVLQRELILHASELTEFDRSGDRFPSLNHLDIGQRRRLVEQRLRWAIEANRSARCVNGLSRGQELLRQFIVALRGVRSELTTRRRSTPEDNDEPNLRVLVVAGASVAMLASLELRAQDAPGRRMRRSRTRRTRRRTSRTAFTSATPTCTRRIRPMRDDRQHLGPGGGVSLRAGEEVKSSSGLPAKLQRPLDFLVVSDHAENLGLRRRSPVRTRSCSSPSGAARCTTWSRRARVSRPFNEWVKRLSSRGRSVQRQRHPHPHDVAAETAAAEKYNEPGRFTAFIGFEWTSTPGGNNLHRK